MTAFRSSRFGGKSRRRPAGLIKRLALQNLEQRLALSAVAWTGAASGSWDVASNWSTGLVPGAGDDVTIDTAAALTICVQSGDSITVNSLTTGANDTLSITGGSLTVSSGDSTINGPLTMSGGAALSLPEAQIGASNRARLTGNASLDTAGDFTNNGSLTVDAGSKISVGGNFTQGSNATLNLQIGGSSASSRFGQVVVHDAATLAGALDVSLANGYVPQNGDDFAVLTFGSVIGNWATVTGLGGSLVETLRPTSVELSATPPDIVQSPLGTMLTASIGAEFYDGVGTFTDSNPAAQASQFVAAIDWGDGQTSNGNVGASGSQFQVYGNHDYAHSGMFTVTTTIVDHGLATTITNTAVVLPWANGRIYVTTAADTHAASPATSPEDSAGNISLRSAVEYLNATGQANDTISFDGIYVRGPLQLTLGQIEIDDSLTIDGENFYQLSIGQATASAGHFFQIDQLDADGKPVAVALSNLTLNLGALAPNNAAAIENLGSLVLTNANFAASLAYSPASGDTAAFVSGGGQQKGPAEINGAIVSPSDDVGLNNNGNVYPFKNNDPSNGIDLSFDTNPTIGPGNSSSPSGNNLTAGPSVPLPASDVVADWRFQEGKDGQPATGAIVDSSGHGVNGTPINAPVYSSNVPFATVPQTGQPDTVSLAFNGTNQQIVVPDNPALQLAHSLTLEALVDVAPTTQFSYEFVLFRGDYRPGLDPYSLSIFGSGTNLSASFNITDASNRNAGVSAPLPGPNQWLDIVGTLDDATGAMRLYVNGVELASTVTSVRPLATLDPTQTPGLGIGSFQSTTQGNYFHGLMNEVRICDVALTPDQFLGSTPGNFVVASNGNLLLDEPAAEVSTLTLDGANGGDTFDITPNATIPIVVRGGAPNDTLVLPQPGNLSQKFDASSGYSGTWSNSGNQPVTFDGIQTLEEKLATTQTTVGEPNANYVTAVYLDVLGRAPDANGLAYWTDLLNRGAAIGSVAKAIAHSGEYFANFVIKPDYLNLLGRTADGAGVSYWTASLKAGLTDQQFEADLVSSNEFFQAAGGTNAAWIEAVYKLLLGRPADASGASHWLSQLAGGATLPGVALEIANSQENDAQLIKNDYVHDLGRAADDAGLAYWLAQFSAGETDEDLIAGLTGSAEYYAERSK